MKSTHKSVTLEVPIEVTVYYEEILSVEGTDADGNRGYYERECIPEFCEIETAGIPDGCHGFIKALALDLFERNYA